MSEPLPAEPSDKLLAPAVPRCRVYVGDDEVATKLASFDLTPNLLYRALWKANSEHQLLTDHDPRWFAGGVLPAKTMRHLRDVLVPEYGWNAGVDTGVEHVTHPTKRLALVVWAGDDRTALPSHQPSTKRPRGEASRVIVDENVQPDLWGKVVDQSRHRLTWALLVRPVAHGVMAELSLPMGVTPSGEIESWKERIILSLPWPETEAMTVPSATPAPKEAFDIASMAQ